MEDDRAFPNIWQAILVMIIAILVSSVVAVVVGAFHLPLNSSWVFMATYVVSMGLSILIAYKLKTNHEPNWKLNWKVPSALLTIAVVLTWLMIWIIFEPLGKLIPINEKLLNLIKAIAENPALSLLSLVAFPALLEEILFRGIILDGLAKRYNVWLAILISALLFGAIHGNLYQFIGGAIGGIFLGWIYVRTQSIVYPILIHAVNNFIPWWMLQMNVDEQFQLRDLFESTAYYYFAFGVAMLCSLMMVFFLNKKLTRLGTTKETL